MHAALVCATGAFEKPQPAEPGYRLRVSRLPKGGRDPAGIEPGEYFLRVDLEGRGEAEAVPIAWQWVRLKVQPRS